MTGPPLKRVYVDISAATHKRAKQAAAREGRTLKALIERLINQHVNRS